MRRVVLLLKKCFVAAIAMWNPLLLRLNELAKLSHQLSAADLESIEALPYFDEFSNNKGGASMGTIYSVNGRRIVLLEQRGERIGVCQAIAGGGTRRPLINYLTGVTFIPAGEEALQAVKFVSEVWVTPNSAKSDSKYVEEH
ncbi:MAG: hypothetical protein HYX67_04915 [Candidatus Melainabacteria bacterium]|nr:hypothetical protein [Candidatus Melainabacteria bacterium]